MKPQHRGTTLESCQNRRSVEAREHRTVSQNTRPDGPARVAPNGGFVGSHTGVSEGTAQPERKGQDVGCCEESTVIETEGLTHIHLLVSDLERSLRFYKSVFGLEEQFRDGPTMVFLRTPGSRDTITINANADQMERVGRGGVDHFGFRLKQDVDLDAAIVEVVEAGGRLIERGEHAPGVPYAYVADPDGYLIEL
jgi:catechol 2,3-dioxygenase-like lactoylglutathione lyase family enzyme